MIIMDIDKKCVPYAPRTFISGKFARNRNDAQAFCLDLDLSCGSSLKLSVLRRPSCGPRWSLPSRFDADVIDERHFFTINVSCGMECKVGTKSKRGRMGRGGLNGCEGARLAISTVGCRDSDTFFMATKCHRARGIMSRYTSGDIRQFEWQTTYLEGAGCFTIAPFVPRHMFPPLLSHSYSGRNKKILSSFSITRLEIADGDKIESS